MYEDKKIINFDNRRKEVDSYDDYEDWEGDYTLISKGDFEGLKKLRETMAKSNPKDINALWRLGEAYVLNKEYEIAIEYLIPLYRKNPDNIDIEHSILDALYALGKNENDFKWVSTPKVLNLNNEVLDYCFDYLKGKRKARGLYDVYCHLIIKGYITFDEEELLKYLDKDGRFKIQKDGYLHNTLLKVVTEKKKKKNLG